MRFKHFWELAEAYTAPLNIFLIILGAAYAHFQFDVGLNLPFLVYTLTILLFHVAVNIFNNYMDYQNASEDHQYKQQTNIIGREGLSLTLVRRYFIVFMGLSSLLGLLLIQMTSLWLVFPGVIGFYVGLFYSAGPRPLNSLPIAETVTALASGYFVPLVALYVLTFATTGAFTARISLQFLVICLPLVLMMFNNLLANNTCDLAEDIVNKRKTLVYYIGKKRAVRLLKVSLVFSFLLLPQLVIVGWAPWTVLLLELLFPIAMRTLRPYFLLQDKKETFPLVLKTMSLVMVGYPCLFLLGLLFS